MEIICFEFDRSQKSEHFSYSYPGCNLSGWLHNVILNEESILEGLEDTPVDSVNSLLELATSLKLNDFRDLALDDQEKSLFLDSFGIDDEFFFGDFFSGPRLRVVPFVAIFQGIYVGHLWTWLDYTTRETICCGARTSFYNYYSESLNYVHAENVIDRLRERAINTFGPVREEICELEDESMLEAAIGMISL